jgi:polyribonucleotide nucleotidyltransferase
VRIGMIDGKFVINPLASERPKSTLDLVVAGTKEAITMVECGAQQIPEAKLVEALELAHSQIKIVVAAIESLRAKVGKPKMAHVEPEVSPWVAAILKEHRADISKALLISNKAQRSAAVKACRDAIVTKLGAGEEEQAADVKAAFGDAKDVVFRELILEGKRVDGRDLTTVRPIVLDLDILPRTHGSSLFTRGETQGILVCTLGTSEDEQMVDSLKPKFNERFMLHYNFPGFSVGEVERRPGPGRREIGHGALARRALMAVLPKQEEFPYVIRLVSEITESNGSSSMATVCGGSMAMMAAGVPITAPVAGIAMGLVMEGSRYAILTDILGDEDHYGDMDFKVCGTETGVTALQMDIKIAGISAEIMGKALEQARQGRLHILHKMNSVITVPRGQLSPYAPQIVQVQIDPLLIGKIIGKGGETIRRIQEETGAKINVDDDGIITIASPDMASIEKAKGWISDLTELPEVGRVYAGQIKAIKDFGAFVEFIPGTEGLVHISEWDHSHIANLNDVAKEGDKVQVKLIEVDARTGKFRLSRKALIEESEESKARRAERAARGPEQGGDDRGPRRDHGDRGPRRDGDRGPRREGHGGGRY